MTYPAVVRSLEPSVFEITIHEGRNRQVRRMCAAIGHPVQTLHRVRYGPLSVDGLGPGQWRDVTGDELEALRRA
jgi:23S rRNA pseudouridine2605 synthase